MSDVPDLLRDPKQPDPVIISHLKTGEAEKGMIPKADSNMPVIQSGVGKVSFVDVRMPNAVMLDIFTDKSVSTRKSGCNFVPKFWGVKSATSSKSAGC